MNSELEIKGPTEYIKEAWVIYTKKENFVFFAKIMALLVLLSTAVGFISAYFYAEDYINNIDYSDLISVGGFVLVSIIAFLLSIWTQSTTYMAIFNIGKDEKIIFNLGYKNIWRYFLISLVFGLIIFGGVLLLIIPAIIFGIWYSFSIYLVLEKNMCIGESLKVSKQMVAGRFWKVLGRSAVITIVELVVSILLSLIPYVGTIMTAFIAPLFLLPYYLLYKDLSVNN